MLLQDVTKYIFSIGLMRAIAPCIAHPLTDLINLSFTNGIFPNNLRIAKVTPIFNSDNKKLLTNYRPVSVLTAFSKIFEKALYNSIWKLIEENNMLMENQYGFRHKHLKYMALLNLIGSILAQIGKKIFNLGMFPDSSKAFDTLDHNILLNNFNMYGIRGPVYAWLSSYLSHRQQHVQIWEVSITCKKCQMWSTSKLGPLLFVLNMNGLVNVINSGNTNLFAYDTSGPYIFI